MELTGLDLGGSSLKCVTIKKETKELLALAYSPAPGVSLESESQTDLENYAKFLRAFVESQSQPINFVSVSLPESKIFNRIMTLPKMPAKELQGAVTFEAEQYLPLPLKDVIYDFKVIEELEEGKKQNVLLVAAPKELIAKYSQIITKANLTLVGLEPETAALARSVVDTAPSPMATLVVSLGDKSTDLTIVYGGVVRFTRSIGTGGAALTRAITQALGFEPKQAEEYKKTYGLDETQLEGKIAKCLLPVFELIVQEIRRDLAYYQTHETNSPALKRLILCGGTSQLPGALVYLASALNLEAQLANPWLKVKNSHQISSRELEEAGPVYAVAVGLALKDI
jgi:type IV pilus assembly protein PilM